MQVDQAGLWESLWESAKNKKSNQTRCHQFFQSLQLTCSWSGSFSTKDSQMRFYSFPSFYVWKTSLTKSPLEKKPLASSHLHFLHLTCRVASVSLLRPLPRPVCKWTRQDCGSQVKKSNQVYRQTKVKCMQLTDSDVTLTSESMASQPFLQMWFLRLPSLFQFPGPRR